MQGIVHFFAEKIFQALEKEPQSEIFFSGNMETPWYFKSPKIYL